MNYDAQMLQKICQSTMLGQNSIRTAIKKVHDPAMQQALSSQLWEYAAIHRQAKKLLQDRGHRAKRIPGILLAVCRMKTERISTGQDCTIAKWMVDYHSRMILQKPGRPALDPKVSTLSNRLLQTAQENIVQMLPYLS